MGDGGIRRERDGPLDVRESRAMILAFGKPGQREFEVALEVVGVGREVLVQRGDRLAMTTVLAEALGVLDERAHFFNPM